jgi:hypothetical protein
LKFGTAAGQYLIGANIAAIYRWQTRPATAPVQRHGGAAISIAATSVLHSVFCIPGDCVNFVSYPRLRQLSIMILVSVICVGLMCLTRPQEPVPFNLFMGFLGMGIQTHLVGKGA